MSSARDDFLNRVRQALAAEKRAGMAPPLPERGNVGYQGAGVDPVARFCAELTAVGGIAHVVPNASAAIELVRELVSARSARKAIVSPIAGLDQAHVAASLKPQGVEVTHVDDLSPDACRDPLFAADVGISGVDYLIAETGTIVLTAKPAEPRSVSLLPPVHIAVAHRSQLLADLFDLFELCSRGSNDGDSRAGPLSSCMSLITGPSKTGDIELRLVTGVHGPGELHVILIAPE
jgi:L-lactate dehydrogenase complex protein LldG